MLIKMQRRLTLKTLMWMGWLAVSVEVGVDLLELKGYLAAVAAAVALSIVSATRSHAERVEAALKEHSNSMARHTFALNQAFQLGLLSDSAARRDAAELHRPGGYDVGGFEMRRRQFG